MPWMVSQKHCRHCQRRLQVLMIHADPPGAEVRVFRTDGPVVVCARCDFEPDAYQAEIRAKLGL